MKRKLLLSLLFLTTAGAVSAQDYIPFLDNTAWNINVANFGGAYNYAIEQDGTVMQGVNTYAKFVNAGQTDSPEFLVREDVAARKVYRYKDGQDELLYDFNLQVGETTTLPDGKLYNVLYRDSVPVMTGRKRVRIYLLHYEGTIAMNSENWIESVGSTEHPLIPSYELMSDPAITVRCSYTNGQNVYNTGLLNNGTPIDCPQVTAAVKELTTFSTSLAPNPFSSSATITTAVALNNASLSIINSLGQQVKQLNNLNGTEITLNRDNLTAGLYFVRLEQNGRVIYSNKVLIAD